MLFNSAIVCGNDDFGKTGATLYLFVDTLYHGFSTNIHQWFSRKSGGFIPCWDNSDCSHIQSKSLLCSTQKNNQNLYKLSLLALCLYKAEMFRACMNEYNPYRRISFLFPLRDVLLLYADVASSSEVIKLF